jgi:hypothetical protein
MTHSTTILKQSPTSSDRLLTTDRICLQQLSVSTAQVTLCKRKHNIHSSCFNQVPTSQAFCANSRLISLQSQ